MVDQFQKQAESFAAQKQPSLSANQEVSLDKEQESDDDLLEFIDPEAERKAKLAEAAAEKEYNQKPKMVKINGKLMPAQSVSLNNATTSGLTGQQATTAGRSALLNQLRDKVMEKTSRNINIA